ncbi:ATP-binding protein [Campylobacter novaezeelandiae]|nr:ATP-binding protein [Campylobacter novaezeelandiae]
MQSFKNLLKLYNNNFIQRKNITFSTFAKTHSYLPIDQLFDFYSVFDGLNISYFSLPFFESIENILLKNYTLLNQQFSFDFLSSYALNLLTKNSRKIYSINRRINYFKAKAISNHLLKTGILKLEKSKEEKIKKDKRNKIKKELRGYVIQDKIIFKNHFLRFFFRFLKPYEHLILEKKFDFILNLIKEELEYYQGFCFEQLSREFLEKKFNIYPVESYWDRKVELDLYYKDNNLSFIGEVKFKNKKICKNILNELQRKAKILNIDVDYYIIFSKNGFSKELNKKQNEKLLLFDLKDFEFLFKDNV